jgi:hypothetical protein
MSNPSNTVISANLTPEQWGFLKAEETRRTAIQAQQAREHIRFQEGVLSIQKEGLEAAKPQLDIRDHFALGALDGIGTWMPNGFANLNSNDAMKARAEWAYRQADAMLKARSAPINDGEK